MIEEGDIAGRHVFLSPGSGEERERNASSKNLAQVAHIVPDFRLTTGKNTISPICLTEKPGTITWMNKL